MSHAQLFARLYMLSLWHRTYWGWGWGWGIFFFSKLYQYSVINHLPPCSRTTLAKFIRELLLIAPTGTYNNMWIAVDYNLFSPGQVLQPNTVVIVEQLPGSLATGDVTTFVRYCG